MLLSDYSYQFCCMTFVAKERTGELCGSNGLPLTPNSIKILGRSQYLISLNHPNLCTYIDVLRGKHERTVIVCEKIGTSLADHPIKDWRSALLLARDILDALSYLHDKGIVHGYLRKDNIFLVNNAWKLFNFGLNYMTEDGADVLFPIGSPKYKAPDVILQGPTCKSSYESDVWSLGIILVEVLLEQDLWKGLAVKDIVLKIIGLIGVQDVFRELAEQCDLLRSYQKMPSEIKDLVNSMLTLDPQVRAKAQDLLKMDIFKLIEHDVLSSSTTKYKRNHKNVNLNHDAMVELYHYWQLAGGDVFSELKKNGLIHNRPPILSYPKLLMLEGMSFGRKKDENAFLDQCVVQLEAKHLIDRFRKLPKSCRYPLESTLARNSDYYEMSTLPLVIRERDTEYQFKRLQLFKHLLKVPEKRDILLKEARQDIPPLVRAKVWAAILEVGPHYRNEYDLIDKETPVPTDRQIEVDIPRCHQYNELLSSSVGHQKFKRVLKAWVKSHPHYVYWQGLDSLSAPFLYLNFQDEARAYASLRKFIDKYLHNFFLKDNSAVIREYLAKLKHLIAFQDPVLASHLHQIGFNPELFAIPWFLTMFSHVFPIHKILHLWDSLILGDASFPLYIGLSILQQLRSVLLDSGFNECILLFSDLPEIDIEKCVKDSIHYYCGTPGSITYRHHVLHDVSAGNLFYGMDSAPISLTDLQNEFSPRISPQELNQLVLKPSIRSKLLIVDVREPSLYKKQSVVGSINVPVSSSDVNGKTGKIHSPKGEWSSLYPHKGKIIVVVGDEMTTVSEFCQFLVQSGFPKVCSLNGGISALSCSDILR